MTWKISPKDKCVQGSKTPNISLSFQYHTHKKLENACWPDYFCVLTLLFDIEWYVVGSYFPTFERNKHSLDGIFSDKQLFFVVDCH